MYLEEKVVDPIYTVREAGGSGSGGDGKVVVSHLGSQGCGEEEKRGRSSVR